MWLRYLPSSGNRRFLPILALVPRTPLVSGGLWSGSLWRHVKARPALKLEPHPLSDPRSFVTTEPHQVTLSCTSLRPIGTIVRYRRIVLLLLIPYRQRRQSAGGVADVPLRCCDY